MMRMARKIPQRRTFEAFLKMTRTDPEKARIEVKGNAKEGFRASIFVNGEKLSRGVGETAESATHEAVRLALESRERRMAKWLGEA
jgi:dsRNA-specific ribonuclease